MGNRTASPRKGDPVRDGGALLGQRIAVAAPVARHTLSGRSGDRDGLDRLPVDPAATQLVRHRNWGRAPHQRGEHGVA